MTNPSQPVSELQFKQLVVEWAPYDSVKPNRYNPNRMTAQDRALLRQSILEDGWTQPVVTLLDGTIVDGEQRWTTAGLPLHTSDVDAIIAKMEKRREQGHPESESIMARLRYARDALAGIEAHGKVGTLAAITGGLVPITRVDFWDDAHKMISTIRHNRARGSHSIDAMADIAQDLRQLGLDFDDLEVRLGMDDEEINRLLEQADLPEQAAVVQATQTYSQEWRPVRVDQIVQDDKLAAMEWERSQTVMEEARRREQEKLARKQEVEARVKAQVEQAHAAGQTLTQFDKDKIVKQAEAEVSPVTTSVAPLELRTIKLIMTKAEYDMAVTILGEPLIDGFLALVRAEGERRARA